MPSTRSSAVTKCISDVPGLVKQTFTPPARRVRTRLSAPFIARSSVGGWVGRPLPIACRGRSRQRQFASRETRCGRRDGGRFCESNPRFAHFRPPRRVSGKFFRSGRGAARAPDFAVARTRIGASRPPPSPPPPNPPPPPPLPPPPP